MPIVFEFPPRNRSTLLNNLNNLNEITSFNYNQTRNAKHMIIYPYYYVIYLTDEVYIYNLNEFIEYYHNIPHLLNNINIRKIYCYPNTNNTEIYTNTLNVKLERLLHKLQNRQINLTEFTRQLLQTPYFYVKNNRD